jgi:hypothetical protein
LAIATGVTSRLGRNYLWWPPPPPLDPAAGPTLGAALVPAFVVLEAGEDFVVVFGGGGGGGGGVKTRKLSIAARATPALHTLAKAKENTVASINVLQVFMTFPLGARA